MSCNVQIRNTYERDSDGHINAIINLNISLLTKQFS